MEETHEVSTEEEKITKSSRTVSIGGVGGVNPMLNKRRSSAILTQRQNLNKSMESVDANVLSSPTLPPPPPPASFPLAPPDVSPPPIPIALDDLPDIPITIVDGNSSLQIPSTPPPPPPPPPLPTDQPVKEEYSDDSELDSETPIMPSRPPPPPPPSFQPAHAAPSNSPPPLPPQSRAPVAPPLPSRLAPVLVPVPVSVSVSVPVSVGGGEGFDCVRPSVALSFSGVYEDRSSSVDEGYQEQQQDISNYNNSNYSNNSSHSSRHYSQQMPPSAPPPPVPPPVPGQPPGLLKQQQHQQHEFNSTANDDDNDGEEGQQHSMDYGGMYPNRFSTVEPQVEDNFQKLRIASMALPSPTRPPPPPPPQQQQHPAENSEQHGNFYGNANNKYAGISEHARSQSPLRGPESAMQAASPIEMEGVVWKQTPAVTLVPVYQERYFVLKRNGLMHYYGDKTSYTENFAPKGVIRLSDLQNFTTTATGHYECIKVAQNRMDIRVNSKNNRVYKLKFGTAEEAERWRVAIYRYISNLPAAR
jgi:hypothetical protein